MKDRPTKQPTFDNKLQELLFWTILIFRRLHIVTSTHYFVRRPSSPLCQFLQLAERLSICLKTLQRQVPLFSLPLLHPLLPATSLSATLPPPLPLLSDNLPGIQALSSVEPVQLAQWQPVTYAISLPHIYLTISLSIYLSFYISIYLSFYLSIHLSKY